MKNKINRIVFREYVIDREAAEEGYVYIIKQASNGCDVGYKTSLKAAENFVKAIYSDKDKKGG